MRQLGHRTGARGRQVGEHGPQRRADVGHDGERRRGGERHARNVGVHVDVNEPFGRDEAAVPERGRFPEPRAEDEHASRRECSPGSASPTRAPRDRSRRRTAGRPRERSPCRAASTSPAPASDARASATSAAASRAPNPTQIANGPSRRASTQAATWPAVVVREAPRAGADGSRSAPRAPAGPRCPVRGARRTRCGARDRRELALDRAELLGIVDHGGEVEEAARRRRVTAATCRARSPGSGTGPAMTPTCRPRRR